MTNALNKLELKTRERFFFLKFYLSRRHIESDQAQVRDTCSEVEDSERETKQCRHSRYTITH